MYEEFCIMCNLWLITETKEGILCTGCYTSPDLCRCDYKERIDFSFIGAQI